MNKKFSIRRVQLICLVILIICILIDIRYAIDLSKIRTTTPRIAGIVRNVYPGGFHQRELSIQTNEFRYPASGNVTVRSSSTTRLGVGDVVDVQCRQIFERENGTRYCLAGDIRLKTLSHSWDIRKGLFEIRSSIVSQFNRILPEPAASITQAVLLGQTDGLSPSLVQDFRLSGTIHLLVVSGTQILFLIQAIYWVLRSFRVSRAWCTRLSTVVCLLYVLMLGDSLSAFRALVLGTIPFIAYDLGRRARPFHLLLLFVTITALVQPTVLLDIGYQLSVAATVGILLFSSFWTERIEKMSSSRALSQLLGVTLAAQAATLPIILVQFGYLPLASFLANPPISLLLSLVTGLGVSAVVASFVSSTVSYLLAGAAGTFGQWAATLTHRFAHIPYATIPSTAMAWAIVIGLLTCSIIAYVRHYRSGTATSIH